MTDFHPALIAACKNYSAAKFRSDLVAGIVVGIVALPRHRIRHRQRCESYGWSDHSRDRRFHRVGVRRQLCADRRPYRRVYRYHLQHNTAIRHFRSCHSDIHGGMYTAAYGFLQARHGDKVHSLSDCCGIHRRYRAHYLPTQMPDFFGLTINEAVPGDFIGKWRVYIANFNTIDISTLLIGLLSLLIIILTPKVSKRIPAP